MIPSRALPAGRLRASLAACLLMSLAACFLMSLAACRSGGARELEPNRLTHREEELGWELLFDGETTRGWRGFRAEGVPPGWVVVDGCLARTGPGGDLVTEGVYGDFVLELEWRISEGGNSGVFFHVSEEGDAVWSTGPEMQVLDDERHADGRDPLTSAGANYGLHAPAADASRPVGEFNRARIEVVDGRVRHVLNGVEVVAYELGSADWERRVAASKFADLPRYGREGRGHIALQDHGDPVWYRSIKVLRVY